MKSTSTLLLLLLLLSTFCSAQNQLLSAVSDSVIAKNNVYKCLEYSKTDSVGFFEKYENGYYGLYNEEGQLFKKNSYSHGDEIREFTIHYIYDHKGRNTMWLWHQPHSIPEISRIRIEHYDSLGHNFGYQDFRSNEKNASAYEIKHHQDSSIIDSLTLSNREVYFQFNDTSRTDTLWTKTVYYTENRIDSITTEVDRPNVKSNSIKMYRYDNFKRLVRTEERVYSAGELETLEIISFSENGLPKERWRTSYYADGEKQSLHSGFQYIFYQEE